MNYLIWRIKVWQKKRKLDQALKKLGNPPFYPDVKIQMDWRIKFDKVLEGCTE